jgi:hypothetical protein
MEDTRGLSVPFTVNVHGEPCSPGRRGQVSLQTESLPWSLPVAPVLDAGYREFVAKAKEFDFNNPPDAIEDEDEKTLAAIDEVILDAENGRTTPIEEVRKRLRKWITASSSPKGR